MMIAIKASWGKALVNPDMVAAVDVVGKLGRCVIVHMLGVGRHDARGVAIAPYELTSDEAAPLLAFFQGPDGED